MEYRKLKDLVEINSENITKNYKEQTINYLDTANITNGKIDKITELGIEKAPSRAKRIVRENDIIYSTVRPNLCHYGILRKVLKNMIVSTGFVVLRCKEEILPEYLYAYITLPFITEKLHSIAETSTSAYPSIKPKDIESLDIPVPPKEIQQKIASILSSLDKKIQLNNKTNNNLHELLKGIYDDWFEKYNYPNSNQSKHINWKRDRLGNYLKVERGLSYKGKFLRDEGTPMVNLGNVMPNGVFRIEKNKYYTGDYKEKVTANVGDIVIANTDMTQNREVLGTPVIIPPIYEDKIIYSHHIYGLKNLKLPKLFVFYSLLKPKFRNLAGGSATGTTVLALPKEVIEDYEIVIPDEETLNSFTELAEKIQKRRENIILENIKLEQLRDTLLPKLMNGEINLDNIEI